ncbi:flagellar filament capping protein FliD [Luteimonas sp. A478]
MADYSFGYGGIGSGLDISSIVNQLVASERAPQDARLNKLEAGAKFKLSGLGGIASAFDTLKGALEKLQKADSLGSRSVTTLSGAGASGPEASVLTATAGRNTPIGRYQIEVLSLASAHKLVGNGMEADTTFDAGSLVLEIGGETVGIGIEAGSNLADVRSAINSAAARHGVQAAILTSDQGRHLSIAGSKTGSEHAISITVDSGGPDLHALVDSLEERTPAADAQVLIDGLPSTSTGNSIGEAVPGLTLQLRATGSMTVDVAADPTGSRAAVQEFVNSYNAALKAIAGATSYNTETRTPSALTGDAQVRGATAQLRGTMGGLLAGLASRGLDAGTLGLQTRGFPDADGSLVLDAAKFDAALAENAAGIIDAFTGEDGLAAQLKTVVDGYVGSDGAFTTRNKSLNDQIKDVTRQREALDTRMENVARRYQTQFVALDSLMAQMTTTSSYLSQQLSMLSLQAQAK